MTEISFTIALVKLTPNRLNLAMVAIFQAGRLTMRGEPRPFRAGETAFLTISQSGETVDTLATLCQGKKKSILTLGIINVVESTIVRETDAGVYNHAGSADKETCCW